MLKTLFFDLIFCLFVCLFNLDKHHLWKIYWSTHVYHLSISSALFLNSKQMLEWYSILSYWFVRSALWIHLMFWFWKTTEHKKITWNFQNVPPEWTYHIGSLLVAIEFLTENLTLTYTTLKFMILKLKKILKTWKLDFICNI